MALFNAKEILSISSAVWTQCWCTNAADK